MVTFRTCSSPQKAALCSPAFSLLVPHPLPAPGNHESAFCLYKVPYSELSYEWNSIICGLLCVASFILASCFQGSWVVEIWMAFKTPSSPSVGYSGRFLLQIKSWSLLSALWTTPAALPSGVLTRHSWRLYACLSLGSPQKALGWATPGISRSMSRKSSADSFLQNQQHQSNIRVFALFSHSHLCKNLVFPAPG